jgi:hypothetical protein
MVSTNIPVNRMATWLEGDMSKYAGEQSVIAKRIWGGGQCTGLHSMSSV